MNYKPRRPHSGLPTPVYIAYPRMGYLQIGDQLPVPAGVPQEYLLMEIGVRNSRFQPDGVPEIRQGAIHMGRFPFADPDP